MSVILITPLSTFPRNRVEIKYKVNVPGCTLSEVTAEQTNESVLRCLSHLYKVKEHGGIDKIIVLCTPQTLKADERYDGHSAYTYYQTVAEECDLHPDFFPIQIGETTLSHAVDSICSMAHEGDVVYIDGAGGPRTTSNVIQIVTKMLTYLGVREPLTLYASMPQGGIPSIETTEDFSRMIDLTDAFHEFMTTGKSDQLITCFKECPHDAIIDNLLSAMSEFSDKIRLGDVDSIDQTINKLHAAISNIRTQSAKLSDGLETVILQQFIPAIEEKLIGNHQEADYPRLIRWCLDNVLIQQALTIFVEKIPIYLFSHGIIRYDLNSSKSGDLKGDMRIYDKSLFTSWEADTLYSKILKEYSLIDECKECLKGKRSSNSNVQNAVSAIKSFETNEIWYAKENELPKGIKRYIKHYISSHKISSYQHFYNSLINNIKDYNFWAQILDLPIDKLGVCTDENISAKKLTTFLRYNAGVPLEKPFYTDMPIKQFSLILLGYIYVKAMRNQINHASSNEKLDRFCKAILSKFGYDFSKYSLSVITKNINLALSNIPTISNLQQMQK